MQTGPMTTQPYMPFSVCVCVTVCVPVFLRSNIFQAAASDSVRVHSSGNRTVCLTEFQVNTINLLTSPTAQEREAAFKLDISS